MKIIILLAAILVFSNQLFAKTVVLENQTFQISDQPEKTTVYDSGLQKEVVAFAYRLLPAQIIYTSYGDFKVKRFLYHSDLPDYISPKWYEFEEDAHFTLPKVGANEAIEIDFKKNSPVEMNLSFPIVNGVVAHPFEVATIHGKLWIEGYVRLGGAQWDPYHSVTGTLAKQFIHQIGRDAFIFQVGKPIELFYDRVVSGWLESSKIPFADGNWMNTVGPAEYDYKRETYSTNQTREAQLFTFGGHLYSWKAIDKLYWRDDQHLLSPLVLAGQFWSPQVMLVPQLELNLPISRIAFDEKDVNNDHIKLVGFDAPFESELCIDYSEQNSAPSKKCFNFKFFNFIKYDGSFDFTAVIKYNKEILWNVTSNGTGVAWKNAKGSAKAATLGYCIVKMQRWTSFLGRYEKASINQYAIEDDPVKSCAKDPNVLASALLF